MLFVPLPFVVALLLGLLFLRVHRREAGGRAFEALILVSIVQSVLSGLRWGYGVQAVMVVAPIGAAIVPPLAYAGVTALVKRNRRPLLQRLVLHGLPSALVALLLVSPWRGVIDLALIATFVGYAIAILLHLRPGADALRLAPFEGSVPAYRAILFAAFALLLSALVDVIVLLDFAWMTGNHVGQVIALGNLGLLIILSVAAAAASRSHTPLEAGESARSREMPPEESLPAGDSQQDAETLSAIQALMEGKRVYRDADLNLDRLARKLGIPARQISAAINRATGKNVSQYVNAHRITEACERLADTDRPVTEIMFEVGFQTKSNFNREFRRMTEMTPLQWREQSAAGSAAASSNAI
jgi:AraC-like DNA-binding protein